MIYVGSFRFLVVLCISPVVVGSSLYFLVVLGCSWWFLVVLGFSWFFLLVLGGSWWFLGLGIRNGNINMFWIGIMIWIWIGNTIGIKIGNRMNIWIRRQNLVLEYCLDASPANFDMLILK